MARSTAADEAIATREALEREQNGIDYDQQPLPGEQEYAPPSLEINRLAAEFAIGDEEVSFQIFRQGQGGHKDLSFIKSVAPDQFSYELLQAAPFNGGLFRVYIRNGSGIKRNFTAMVESTAPAATGASIGNNGGNSGTTDNAIASMIAAMSAGFTQLSQQLAQSRAPSGGMGVEETIKLIGSLQGLTGGHAPRAPDRDPLDMLERMLTIQKLITPPAPISGDAGDQVMVEAIRAVGPAITEMMKGRAPTQQLAAPEIAATVQELPQLPAPLSNPIDEIPGAVAPAPSEFDMKIAVLRPVIMIMASNGADPYPYANMLLDAFSDEEIAQYIDAPDWFEQLCIAMPEAVNFKPWFSSLRDEVLKLLQEAKEDDNLGSPLAP